MIFFFEFVFIVDYVDGFPYIEPSLHPWNEAYLPMMADCLDVLLDFIWDNFLDRHQVASDKPSKQFHNC